LGETTIERGDYLVNTITACGNCHSPRKAEGRIIADKALSGGLTFDTPTFVTTAPNITPDRETGIGSWSDAEIKRLLVEGVRPDHGRPPGTQLAAMMPANFYKALLPDDLAAVVAYLRSIKPVRNEVAVPVHKLPIHRDAYPEAEAGFSQAMMTNPVQHGAYLAAIGHCMELSPGVLARRQRFQDRARQGRPRLPVARRRARQPNSVAANITSHPTAGIGGWSDVEIARAIQKGLDATAAPCSRRWPSASTRGSGKAT
jgi:mono/diheme cytochrome c family protein